MIRLLSWLLFGHKLCLFFKQIFYNLLDLEVWVRVLHDHAFTTANCSLRKYWTFQEPMGS